MVVTPPKRRISTLLNEEEMTYREAIKTLREATRDIYDERLAALDRRFEDHIANLRDGLSEARLEATRANDNLQDHLELALTKVSETAKEARSEINTKADMQYAAASSFVKATEERLFEKITALERLIDLRARNNELAVEKANEATEKRFDAANDFRGSMADQARQFVTISVLDARIGQLDAQITSLERQIRTDQANSQTIINTLSNRIERREAAEETKKEVRTGDHLTIGSVVGIVSAAVVLLGLVFTVIVNSSHPITPPVAPSPVVGIDSKRVDDLVSRLNDLQSRMTTTSPPGRP
jgi:hypothetical protein